MVVLEKVIIFIKNIPLDGKNIKLQCVNEKDIYEN
jgi:hypothetical protein